ncbi:MAG: exodeoxyribonuclease III [Clostridiales bacterium]|nr:exodeoxyribonuclease III [Clostridiales bacterium]
MKIVSWNVNGLRAAITKGFYDFFNEVDADLFGIQETKMQENQVDDNMKKLGNYQYWNSAEKKGYSGTAVFLKNKPLNVTYGSDNEGRVITCEYEDFFFVNCYVPNSKRELERLDYRMEWEDQMRDYLISLDKVKPVIYCGDLNVAHKEIDLKNPNTNHRSAGFTDEEREKMTKLLDAGFIDTFRYINPDLTDAYSWWSYMFRSREKNIGWRIDYVIVSDRIKDKIKDVKIYSEILGSDHCPVGLDIDL